MAVAIFAAVIVVIFHGAIFRGEVLAPVDLLTKELPWREVLPRNVEIENSTVADVLAYNLGDFLRQAVLPRAVRH